MGRLLRWVLLLGVIAAGTAWYLSGPDRLPESVAAGLTGDPVHGAQVFTIAGCASCHTAPDAAVAADGLPVLAGGQRIVSDFGTFLVPNISPSPQGIGDWSDEELMNAVMRGVAPDGSHLYPAFPYDAYSKAAPQDIADLIAHLRTLPPDATPSLPHEVSFPFNIRRALGLWKVLFRSDDWVLADAQTPQIERGRYLVESLGHCAECHTPRNALGGLNRTRWMAGADNPVGDGGIPGIAPGALNWSESDIANYLETGFTPDFDTVGGEMVKVMRNTAQLTDEDRAAIAAYLKAIPSVSSES